MKSSILRSLGLVLLLACSTARATLIGDTVTLTHDYFTTHVTTDVLVQAGNADATLMLAYYTVNPEATSISVQFLGSPNRWGSGGFNGLIVSGINDTITGVSVTTNLSNWNDSRISFDGHSVSSNWENLEFSSASFFNIALTTGAVATPDGGATGAMLGLAIIGLVAARRREA